MRGLDVHEGTDAIGNFVERIHAKSEAHAALRAELIDQELRVGMAFDVLKEQRGASRTVLAGARFAHAVGNLGDLENRVGFRADFAELAGALEGGDPVAEIVVGQVALRENT